MTCRASCLPLRCRLGLVPLSLLFSANASIAEDVRLRTALLYDVALDFLPLQPVPQDVVANRSADSASPSTWDFVWSVAWPPLEEGVLPPTQPMATYLFRPLEGYLGLAAEEGGAQHPTLLARRR